MYDTIEIRSPILDEDLVLKIQKISKRLQQVDMETGEILFQVTTSELVGSYDARLSIRIVNGRQVKISGSVHKFILGHNTFGGPKDIKGCCRYLVQLAKKRLGVDLPGWHNWELMRADIAHVFNLGSIENVRDYLRSMRGCTYPRRQARNYGLFGFYFPGASTTLKAYNKGPEFRVHDRKRLLESIKKDNRLALTNEKVELLEQLANCLIRFEVEVRSRKLKYDNMDIRCGSLEDEYFDKVYEKDVLKVMKEGASDMEVVRDLRSVKLRLHECYSKRKANNLFNVWSRIQLEGEEKVKSEVSRTSWYNYKKEFALAGCSLGGNIIINWEDTILPTVNDRLVDFVPLPGNKCHIEGHFCDIDKAISQLMIA